MATGICVLLCLILVNFAFVAGLPEQTVWNMNINQDMTLASAVNSLYANTGIAVKLHCTTLEASPVKLQIRWMLRYTPCAEEYLKVESISNEGPFLYLRDPQTIYAYNYSVVEYMTSNYTTTDCTEVIYLPDLSGTNHTRKDAKSYKPQATTEEERPAGKTDSDKANRKKRAVQDIREVDVAGGALSASSNAEHPTTTTQKPTGATKATTIKSSKPHNGKAHDGSLPWVYHTWQDGVYMFILEIKTDKDVHYEIEATITMKGPQGYLSAIDWPLLPFYGSMCLVYVIYGLVWLVMAMCNWRDLLRIQFWIGGVIFLGMLEKAVYFAEFESINASGKSVHGAVVFAELVSCVKRTLARMLVIIVSLGFGIVKPRLGPMLHRVLGVGILYFILGAVEGLIRTLSLKTDMSRQQLFASIPLAVLDAAICWWIFTSLVQTTRTLRLRRNLVKLSLYRHFTNTLIFAVLASVAFMIWSLKQHKLAYCLTDWKEIWVDEAFWHLLFSLILLIIMILWRPTINNQRYAFSPLLDAADDEEEEEDTMMNDAFDGMKLRGKATNGSPRQKDDKNKAEDDLKWVEENIPSSVVDAALPALLDSDEEVVATQYERSKMQ